MRNPGRPPVVAFLLLLSAASCRSPESRKGRWEDWQPSENAYAGRFAIWSRGEDRLVLVFGHGGEQDTVGAYWITREASTENPPVRAIPLHRRLRAVAVGSTTHVPYIALLGHASAIKACAHMDQVRDTAFARLARGGAVKEIATADGLDREALLVLKPEALFAYPFGRGEATALESLGIPTIEVSEYLEDHPLGRAEWLRFFGVLFGEERKADSLFAGIHERYETLRVDSAVTARPTVLFGSVWDGQWWVPPGNSYMARLIEDAGGRYVFADRTGDGNIAVDMETMITVGGTADYWGMIADIPSEPSERDFTNRDPRLASFRSVQQDRLILANTHTEDLFGQALIEPDRVLSCLRERIDPHIAVDHPQGYRPNYFGGMYRTPSQPEIERQ